MAAGIFDLDHDAGRLTSASAAWTDLAGTLEGAAEQVTTGSQAVRGAGWEGATATSYDGHRKELVSGVDKAQAVAGRIAAALDMAAGSIRAAQGQLDAQWGTVAAIPHSGDDDLTFQVDTEDEAAKVRDALAAAQRIRDELDATLAKDTATLREAQSQWSQLSSTWESVASGDTDPFDLPAEGDGTGIITVGDQTVVNTGDGDDEVTVSIDPLTGDQLVTVDGQTYRVPADQHLVIRSGGGDDTVSVPAGVDLDLTIASGEGEDTVHGGAGDESVYALDGRDSVEGGGGDDRLSGGADRDYLDGQEGDDAVHGGLGDDTVYGLDGDDTLSGGEGVDFHEGGSGSDTVLGGDGDDILSGGADDDVIRGGAGDDVSYAGRGADTTYGGSGSDTSHAEDGDRDAGVERTVTVEIPDTAGFIKIEGSSEFVARVEADLELLRSSPRGQEMLENLQQNHDDSGFLGWNKDTLTIREYFDDNNRASHDGHGNNVVEYNPARNESVDDRPPIVGFHHELAHIYDYMNGTFRDDDYDGVDTIDHGIKEGERVAAGLPIDDDGDPDTPERIDPDHPFDYTENGLRDEFGHPRREHYGG